MGRAWCAMVCLAASTAWATPEEARTWKARGGERAKAGDHAGAVEMYDRAVAADPDDLEAQDRLATHRIALGAVDEAIVQLESVLERRPEHASGYYLLAFCYRETGRLTDAVSAYTTYIKLRPDDPDPYYGYARVLHELGDRPSALRAFRTYVLMERRPQASAWIERAQASIRDLESAISDEEASASVTGAEDQAAELERCRTRVRDDPEDGAAWAALAQTLRDRGQTREADWAERRAQRLQAAATSSSAAPPRRDAPPSEVSPLERRPEGVDALLPVTSPPPPGAKGDAAASPGSERVDALLSPFASPRADVGAEDVERLRTAVRDNPEDAETWFLLATALRAAGQTSDSERAERRANQLSPGLQGRAGRRARPADALRTAEEEASDLEAELRQQASAWMDLGDRMLRERRFEEALSAYTEAAAADPKNAEAEYKKGLAAIELGRRDEAGEAFDRALSRDPNHAGAREQRRRLRSP